MDILSVLGDAINEANKFVKDNTGGIDVTEGLNKASAVINDGINKLSKVTGYENTVKELQNVHYSIVEGGYNNRSSDTWNNENIDSHYYVTPDNSEITLF
ncbi:MAG: hypothetical protein KTV77_01625 [Wolbachia endosymbiont of Fragariocoptes setiger]|nr:hypothetical protein [Wolbachia endosymbiont of Fragariocoptes setiger]